MILYNVYKKHNCKKNIVKEKELQIKRQGKCEMILIGIRLFWKSGKRAKHEDCNTVNGIKSYEMICDETEMMKIWKQYFRNMHWKDNDILREEL